MKYKIAVGILAILILFACAAPIVAHHAVTAEFDGHTLIPLTGTLTKVSWINPHIFFYVDVKNKNNKVDSWTIESGPTVALHRQGAKRNMFVEGDVIDVQVNPAKDGTKYLGFLRHVKFKDGTEIAFANTDDPPISNPK